MAINCFEPVLFMELYHVRNFYYYYNVLKFQTTLSLYAYLVCSFTLYK